MSSSKEVGQILSGKYIQNMPAVRLFFETVCLCVLGELGVGVAVLHL